MKKTMGHLPQYKKEELKEIVNIIRTAVKKKVEMIILFGSYASVYWVEDVYTEGHITYEYKSDVDILVVVKTKTFAKTENVWRKIEKLFEESIVVKTKVSLIVHDIDSINRMLAKGQYFFTDIKKEGIYLFNSGKFQLARRRKLKPLERQQSAQKDYDHWFTSAGEFFDNFLFNFKQNRLHTAAFELHQATERYLVALLLVFTGYKPKTHDLKELVKSASNQAPVVITVFPKTDKLEKKRFSLLRRAYIDARYDMENFKATREDLQWLGERVRKLRDITAEICRKKISSFV